MEKYRIEPKDIIVQSFIILIANLVASWGGLYITQSVAPSIPNDNIALYNFITVTIMCVLNFAICGAIYYFFLKSRICDHYKKCEDKWFWAKNAALLFVPGEIIRFLITLVKLGIANSTGMFALIPSCCFDWTYLIWSGRTKAVRHYGEYISMDVFAYFVCYLIYFVVYAVLVLLLYRYLWLKEKAEKEDLVLS